MQTRTFNWTAIISTITNRTGLASDGHVVYMDTVYPKSHTKFWQSFRETFEKIDEKDTMFDFRVPMPGDTYVCMIGDNDIQLTTLSREICAATPRLIVIRKENEEPEPTFYEPTPERVFAASVYTHPQQRELINKDFAHRIIAFRPPKVGESFVTNDPVPEEVMMNAHFQPMGNHKARFILAPPVKTLKIVW